MKKTTRFLALVLAAVLLLAGAPLSAGAAAPTLHEIAITADYDNCLIVGNTPQRPKWTISPNKINFNLGSCYWEKYDPVSKTFRFTTDPVTDVVYRYHYSLYCDMRDWTVSSNVRVTVNERECEVKVSEPDEEGHYYLSFDDLTTLQPRIDLPTLLGGVSLSRKGVAYVGETVTCTLSGAAAALPAEDIHYQWEYQYNGRQGLLGGLNQKSIMPGNDMRDYQVRARVGAEGYSGYLYSDWITIETPKTCTVTFDPNGGSGAMTPQVVQAGQEFTFPACAFTPPAGKAFDYWSVAGKKNSFFEPGDSMEVTGDVTVKANWKDKSSGPSNPFVDVEEDAYYYEPVLWAVSQTPAITAGTDATHFSPAKECTRAQVVTFLWNAAGQPEPGISSHPFTDVKEGAYYYKAMLWALEKNITAGTSATTFGPNAQCTRGQVVRFLWNAAGAPAPDDDSHPFTDVKEGAYYYDAMLWAVNHTPQITAGSTATTFAPAKPCTRGQVVSFLYRAIK